MIFAKDLSEITYANNSSFHLLMSDIFGGTTSSSGDAPPKEGPERKRKPEYDKYQLFERMKATKLIQINFDTDTSIKVKKEVGFLQFMGNLLVTAFGLAKFQKPLNITVDF